MNHHPSIDLTFSQIVFGFLFICLIILYVMGVIVSNQLYKKWPFHRTFFWIAGLMIGAAAVVGPLAVLSHTNFIAHMAGHLLLGMLAPLLLALGAPMTLLLRAVNTEHARRITKLLKSRLFHFISHPITATILNMGGLWFLYTTNLYHAMHQNIALHMFIHFHVLGAGYIFTVSIIQIDRMPKRKSFLYRAIVFILALTAHGILAKYIYAHPPNGLPASEAKIGAQLMYYGGDLIDAILIMIFCFQWYRDTKSIPSNKINTILFQK